MFCMSGDIMPGGAGKQIGLVPGGPGGPGAVVWLPLGVWLLIQEGELGIRNSYISLFSTAE